MAPPRALGLQWGRPLRRVSAGFAQKCGEMSLAWKLLCSRKRIGPEQRRRRMAHGMTRREFAAVSGAGLVALASGRPEARATSPAPLTAANSRRVIPRAIR